MKRVFAICVLLFVVLTVACNAQPNATSTYEVGIVNPLAGKTYLFFADIKTDTSTTQLVNNMDYLSPNVSSLLKTLTNFRTVGDTTFGEFTLNDVDYKRFIKGGLVQKDTATNKYSGMTVTFWSLMDQLEKRPGFFMRKKK